MVSEQEQQVLNLINERRTELIEDLKQYIGFKTITPLDGDSVTHHEFTNFQALMCATLQAMGFELDTWEADSAALERFPGSGVNPARDLSNMPIVVGRLPGQGDGRSLILNGHYDVVSPGELSSWSHDPFVAKVEAGRVYGRGTCDMKGGLAAMLHAIRCIQAAGIELAGDLTVEIVPDEEGSSMGTLTCCQRGYRADAAIIPEPTDMKILVAMRGSLYGTITVLGRAGHAESTHPHWTEGGAVNAIVLAAKVIEGLETLKEQWRTRPDCQHPLLDPDTIIPTVIKGGDWPVTVPEKVEITFGAVFIPGTTDKQAEIEAQLKRIAELDPWMREHPPQLDVGEWWYGAEIDPDEPIVRLATEVLQDLDLEPALTGFGSLTDAIHLINYANIPTISIGPGTRTAHMADEYVNIEELVSTAQVIALAIMRWCGSKTQ